MPVLPVSLIEPIWEQFAVLLPVRPAVAPAHLLGCHRQCVPDRAAAPAAPPKPKGGRPHVSDRACLTGIRFILKSGIPREMLPLEMGCGSGVTCWRRLRNWQEVGVWDRLHQTLLDRLGTADRIDWERACLDSASIPAKGGATKSGQTPPIAASRAPSCP